MNKDGSDPDLARHKVRKQNVSKGIFGDWDLSWAMFKLQRAQGGPELIFFKQGLSNFFSQNPFRIIKIALYWPMIKKGPNHSLIVDDLGQRFITTSLLLLYATALRHYLNLNRKDHLSSKLLVYQVFPIDAYPTQVHIINEY